MEEKDQPQESRAGFNGGPPKPPKKTANDMFGDSGGLPDFEYAPDRLEVRMQSLVTHALLNLAELGRTSVTRPRILESLETNLDEDVVLLGRHIGQLSNDDRKQALDCLVQIRDYRRTNPRIRASDSQQALQAKKILETI